MRPTPCAVAALPLALALAALSGCESPGVAECPDGQVRCNSVCRDVRTDPAACGSCLNPCPTGATCDAGTCACPTGTTVCAGACVDLLTDRDHCGTCGFFCGEVGTCEAGACVCDPAPVITCLGPPTTVSACANPLTDTSNCGDCGISCKLGARCDAGTCACPPTRPTDCPAGCFNLQTDAANCGVCGFSCPRTNDVCVAGECACPASLPDPCPTSCVNRLTDERNCGTCGNRCPTDRTCQGGSCVCAPGLVSCTPVGGAPLCCEGPGCCSPGGGCMTRHSAGAEGAVFFDCNPLYVPPSTTTRDAAIAAALAWAPGGLIFDGTTICGTSCVGVVNAAGTRSGVWCFGPFSAVAGRWRIQNQGTFGVDSCPNLSSGTWQ